MKKTTWMDIAGLLKIIMIVLALVVIWIFAYIFMKYR